MPPAHIGGRGIKNVAVDAMIEIIATSNNRKEIVNATRALDRILAWEIITVPEYYKKYIYLAHNKNIAIPDKEYLYGPDTNTFWDKSLETNNKLIKTAN